MIFRIKYVCEEVDDFLRELKIDSDSTFLDLNKAILDSCGYADDQMTSFYICNEEWERSTQVTREDMGIGDADQDIYVMSDTKLSELIEDEEQHLEFVYDPFSDRCFYLDVKEILSGDLEVPEIIRSRGNAPQQIEMMEEDPLITGKDGKKKAAASYDDFGDDPIMGGASYNDDEIDWDGFEISDGIN